MADPTTVRVQSYAHALERAALLADRRRLRRWSAIRRGVVVGVALLVATWLFGPLIGAVASVAALLVGLQDRNEPPRFTSKVMAVEGLVLGVSTFTVGFFSANQLVAAALLVLTAGLAGLTSTSNDVISRMFVDVIAVVAFLSLSEFTFTFAWHSAVAVAGAAWLQAVTTYASSRVVADRPERMPLAYAMLTVADRLHDIAARDPDSSLMAEKALGNASRTLSNTNLVRKRRRRLRKILAATESIRVEATAMANRDDIPATGGADPDLDAALDLAQETLRTGASLLELMPSRMEAQLSALDPLQARAERILDDPDDHRATVVSLADACLRIIHQIRELPGVELKREGSDPEKVTTDIWYNLTHPTKRDVELGARLMVATAVSLFAASFFSLGHGAWVAATSVALLRPVSIATTTNIVIRGAGTLIGALLSIGLVYVAGESSPLILALAVGLAVVSFAVTNVNEGLYVVALTMQTIFARATEGSEPIVVATDRAIDVLVGCLVALMISLLLPLRRGRDTADLLADYADATGRWIAGFGSTLSEENRAYRKRRMRMRETRVEALEAVDRRQLQPYGSGLSALRAHEIYEAVEQAGIGAATAFSAARHGHRATPSSEVAARESSKLLLSTARVLRGASVSEESLRIVRRAERRLDDEGAAPDAPVEPGPIEMSTSTMESSAAKLPVPEREGRVRSWEEVHSALLRGVPDWEAAEAAYGRGRGSLVDRALIESQDAAFRAFRVAALGAVRHAPDESPPPDTRPALGTG